MNTQGKADCEGTYQPQANVVGRHQVQRHHSDDQNQSHKYHAHDCHCPVDFPHRVYGDGLVNVRVLHSLLASVHFTLLPACSRKLLTKQKYLRYGRPMILIRLHLCGKREKGQRALDFSTSWTLEDTAARLTDDYINASDSYQNAIERVDEQLLGGEIEEENLPALKAHACRTFFAWARENKARFDRFRPGFHEQKFPAAPAESINQAQQA